MAQEISGCSGMWDVGRDEEIQKMHLRLELERGGVVCCWMLPGCVVISDIDIGVLVNHSSRR